MNLKALLTALIFSIISNTHLSAAAYSSDGSETENHIVRYVRSPSDILYDEAPVKLVTLDPQRSLLVHENAEFQISGSTYPVANANDHELHYLIGDIDREAHARTNASFINFLILALDASYLTSDEYGRPILERKTCPLLLERESSQLTLIPSDSTEICVFMSWCRRAKKNHSGVVNLSKSAPFMVHSRGKTYPVYFHPSNIRKDKEAQTFMYERFPFLNEDKNFDSEVNAVYVLLQNEALVAQLFQGLTNPLDVYTIGLRYYSFLDMCTKCQRFLELNQPYMKGLFMRELGDLPLFGEEPLSHRPFVVVAHGNRIYKNNEYSSGDAPEIRVSRLDYPYAVSGPEEGTFASDLPRFARTLIPRTEETNRLVVLLHEPDLGLEDSSGKVRKYFKDVEEVEFDSLGLNDEQANTLAAKLERANPVAVAKINLENNRFGREEPEFLDDPIPLTNPRELRRVFDFISQCIKLKELKIGANRLFQETPFFSLLSALSQLVNLRVLDLSDIGMGADCTYPNPAGDLSTAILPLTNLEVLNLNYNFFYCAGIETLAAPVANFLRLKAIGLAYTAPCFKDGRTHADDPFNESLEYDPDRFFALASVLRDLPMLEKVDIRSYNRLETHLKEQISPGDIEEFSRIILLAKPDITIDAKTTRFKPRSYQ